MTSRCPFHQAVDATAAPARGLARLVGAAARRFDALLGRPTAAQRTGESGDAASAEDRSARVKGEARELVEQLVREGALAPEAGMRRLAEIEASVDASGTYEHTALELEQGAKLAWRNAARCVGRLYWDDLTVRDLRHATSADEVFEALVEHLRIATNGGKIKPLITFFPARRPGEPGVRIWNSQLIRYAGYRQPDGSVVGDPDQVELTDIVRGLGWAGGPGTPFDVLPLVIQMPGEEPRLFELPPDAVLEVPLTHPDFAWFGELGLKWHAVPAIANMRTEIGGVSYTAAPFNGWYMGTEIGARNLADESRYNLLPTIAARMGLDTHTNRTLWRDRAIVELNVAVLHSFQRAKVTIIDHHTACRHFARHEEYERQAGRTVPGDWSWLVPPISGSTSPLWARSYKNITTKPAYLYQKAAWKLVGAVKPAATLRPVPPPLADQPDELTGLARLPALAPGLATLARAGGAIAVMDVDGLAAVNAELGRQQGDAVLRAVGRAIRAVLRPDDVCVRTGGDEMCVLLPGIERPEDAARVAQRVRAAAGAIYLPDAPTLTVRASMGVALCAPGEDASRCLARAREALRRAKAGGRDRMILAEADETARESVAA